MEQIELDVTGMTCGGCVSRVKQAMLDVPGVYIAEVDLAKGVARASGDNASDAAWFRYWQHAYWRWLLRALT